MALYSYDRYSYGSVHRELREAVQQHHRRAARRTGGEAVELDARARVVLSRGACRPAAAADQIADRIQLWPV